MPKSRNIKHDEPGAPTVNLNVLNDGTVALVFSMPIQQLVVSAEEAKQLGVNLVSAATVAEMQKSPMLNKPEHAAAPRRVQ